MTSHRAWAPFTFETATVTWAKSETVNQGGWVDCLQDQVFFTAATVASRKLELGKEGGWYHVGR